MTVCRQFFSQHLCMLTKHIYLHLFYHFQTLIFISVLFSLNSVGTACSEHVLLDFASCSRVAWLLEGARCKLLCACSSQPPKLLRPHNGTSSDRKEWSTSHCPLLSASPQSLPPQLPAPVPGTLTIWILVPDLGYLATFWCTRYCKAFTNPFVV